jgi:hypothetical protein
MSEHKNNDQADVFERLRNRVKDLMQRFGVPDSLSRDGDYAVHGDYNGHPQVVVFVGNLELLRPKIVDELQKVIREFPGWEIDVTVAIRGHYSDWPSKVHQTKEPSHKDDFDEWLARIICFAFGA